MRRTRTAALAGLLAAAALVTSGCSAHPGAAAVVGADRIGDTRLDALASALCAAQSAGQNAPPQELASRAARQGALDVLINSELSRQFGASQGVSPDQAQVSAALAASEQNVAAIPADRRQVFRETLRSYAEGQLMLVKIGRAALTAQGTANPTQQQSIETGTELRNAWAAKNVSVSVDPRYGSYRSGAVVPRSGSVSVPVSDSAVEAAKPQPGQAWVATLPANQKCS